MNPSSPACGSNSDNSEKGGRIDSCPPEECLCPEEVVTLLDYLLPLLRWRWLTSFRHKFRPQFAMKS